MIKADEKGVCGMMEGQKNVSEATLKIEADKLLGFIKGKRVEKVYRYRSQEVVLVFSDGGMLFIDSASDLEFSIR